MFICTVRGLFLGLGCAVALAAQVPVIESVVSYFHEIHGEGKLSPGAAAVIAGRGLSGTGRACQAVYPTYPKALCNSRVLVNEIPQQLAFVAPTGIQFELSPALTPGAAAVVVEVNGVQSTPTEIVLQRYSPEVLPFTDAIDGNRSPGSRVALLVSGVGAVGVSGSPEVLPAITIGEHPAVVVQTGFLGSFAPMLGATTVVFAIPWDLPAGTYDLTLAVGEYVSNAIPITTEISTGPVTPSAWALTNSGS